MKGFHNAEYTEGFLDFATAKFSPGRHTFLRRDAHSVFSTGPAFFVIFTPWGGQILSYDISPARLFGQLLLAGGWLTPLLRAGRLPLKR